MVGTIGDTASLLDVQANIQMELYTYLCWPVVSEKTRAMNGDSQ